MADSKPVEGLGYAATIRWLAIYWHVFSFQSNSKLLSDAHVIWYLWQQKSPVTSVKYRIERLLFKSMYNVFSMITYYAMNTVCPPKQSTWRKKITWNPNYNKKNIKLLWEEANYSLKCNFVAFWYLQRRPTRLKNGSAQRDFMA